MFIQEVRYIPHLIIYNYPAVVWRVVIRDLMGRQKFFLRHPCTCRCRDLWMVNNAGRFKGHGILDYPRKSNQEQAEGWGSNAKICALAFGLSASEGAFFTSALLCENAESRSRSTAGLPPEVPITICSPPSLHARIIQIIEVRGKFPIGDYLVVFDWAVLLWRLISLNAPLICRIRRVL